MLRNGRFYFEKIARPTWYNIYNACFLFAFLGETPYPGIASRDVFNSVKRGNKMKKPEYCDDA